MTRIRPYQAGDGKRISELFSRLTPYKRDSDFWLWINRIWPEKPSIIAVAEDDGEIVGHYAILPFTIQYGDRLIRSGLGIHAFVAPDSRGKVPIFQISKKCYSLARDAGIQFLWGFPNANYRIIQEKVEGWQRVELFNAWEKTCAKQPNSSLELETINLGDANQLLRLSDFIDICPLGAHFGVTPSLKGWLNRYDRHPQNNYVFHLAMAGTQPVAALVTKIYNDPSSGIRNGHLVDLASLPSVNPTELITALDNWFASRADRLSFWPINPAFRAGLEATGFKDTGFSTFFGIKLLDPSLESIRDNLSDPANWNLVMGMSDVF